MKTLRLLTCLLLALLMLAGCADPEGPDTPDTTPPAGETTAPSTTAGQSATVLFDGDIAYSVVRADECPQSMVKLSVEFKNRISELLGVRSIGIVTDWQKPGTEPDPEAHEILFGYTNRPETAEVLETLHCGDFAIRRVGNKIVVAAVTPEDLRLAADYFITQLVTVQKQGDKTVMSMSSDYIKTTGSTDLFSAQNPLSGYRIVYAKGDSYAEGSAATLAKAIVGQCGVTLETVPDTTPEGECEILVGVSKRAASKSLESLTGINYAIRVEGKKLVLGGGNAMATSQAVDSFIFDFASGLCTPDVRISNGYSFTNSGSVALSDGEDPALAEGADLRVMSFNIQAEMWNDMPPIAGRDLKLATVLYCYSPDVVGLQEVTADWYRAIDSLMSGTYEFAVRRIPAGGVDYSTLLYNTERVELLESGCEVYSLGNDPKLRNLTWGHFRRKSDGATFIVTSTHWDLSSNAHMQKVQAIENAKHVNELYKRFNCPIFCTGDYNESEKTEDFTTFLSSTGMQDPKYSAAVVNRGGKSTHTRGSTPATDSSLCIDHIATTGGVDVRYYNTLIAQTALDVSDHCPIYIDVRLK